MIRIAGLPAPPVPRLLAALAARGHPVESGRPFSPDSMVPEGTTLVLGPGDEPSMPALLARAGAPRGAGPRLLVLSLVGAHPDARVAMLRRLWALEEQARATGLPVLTLRLAPIVGPRSPLWLKLRTRPGLPRGSRRLLNPVFEPDVLDTLERALSGRARWEGWYEVAGPEAVSLAELAAWARGLGPAREAGVAAWEPPLEVLAEQRLSDARPWVEHFGIEPARLSAGAMESAA